MVGLAARAPAQRVARLPVVAGRGVPRQIRARRGRCLRGDRALGDSARYAVYFVPAAESPLYRFGASILGYDCYAGDLLPYHDAVNDDRWPQIVAEPRRYGFHATLKAPFHLAESVNASLLQDAAERFAAGHCTIPAIDLSVRAIGDFVALLPGAPSPALQELAAGCVRAFDPFRAPLSQAEHARRLQMPLNEAERAHLERWGYPYVLDRFRFHMTLTGRLGETDRLRATATLQKAFADTVGSGETEIDGIALLRQATGAEPFRLIGRWPLQRSDESRPRL